MITKQKRLSKIILDRRKELDITQKEVANRIGIKNGQYIYNIEVGKCGFPLKSLAKLSIALQIPLETLKQAIVQDYYDNITETINKSL